MKLFKTSLLLAALILMPSYFFYSKPWPALIGLTCAIYRVYMLIADDELNIFKKGNYD